jgi:hypothetical protein
VLTEGADLVCQPTGRVPAALASTSTVAAMTARSVASAMPASGSQRQPWALISCPEAAGAAASAGVTATARPQQEKVAFTPKRSSRSRTRHSPTREP